MTAHARFRALCLLLTLILLLVPQTACTANQPTNPTDVYYTFLDDLGNEVTLAKKPQRVAVLFSSFADIWKSAGGTVDVTVGESVERGFADATALLVDKGAGKTVDTEALIAARPDFVICSMDVAAHLTCAELLSRYGIAAACFRVEAFADYLRVLKICTEITQRADLYQKNGIEVKERIDGMLAALQGANTQRVLFVRASATSVKAKLASDHFAAAMLEELGAYNIANDASVLIDGISEETLLEEDPHRIFVTFMGDEASAKSALASNKVWQSLSAVKEQRCHHLPKSLFQYKPNARWDEAYAYLIDLLYEKP